MFVCSPIIIIKKTQKRGFSGKKTTKKFIKTNYCFSSNVAAVPLIRFKIPTISGTCSNVDVGRELGHTMPRTVKPTCSADFRWSIIYLFDLKTVIFQSLMQLNQQEVTKRSQQIFHFINS